MIINARRDKGGMASQNKRKEVHMRVNEPRERSGHKIRTK